MCYLIASVCNAFAVISCCARTGRACDRDRQEQMTREKIEASADIRRLQSELTKVCVEVQLKSSARSRRARVASVALVSFICVWVGR